MRRIFQPLAGLALSILLSAAGGAADLAVGTATARAGQKATGFIQVPAGVDAAGNIPVIVIHGARPGPTLALVAGSHGTEYASIIALQKLAQSVDPAGVSGALIIVPLVNPASFAQKVPHLNPVDGKNMNRFFPGKADGTQTERPDKKSANFAMVTLLAVTRARPSFVSITSPAAGSDTLGKPSLPSA